VKIKRWLKKEKLKCPVHVVAGDTIHLEYSYDGKTTEVVRDVITKTCVFDEARIFSCEVDGKYGLGGVFLGKEN
jgi:hypothetical protein